MDCDFHQSGLIMVDLRIPDVSEIWTFGHLYFLKSANTPNLPFGSLHFYSIHFSFDYPFLTIYLFLKVYLIIK